MKLSIYLTGIFISSLLLISCSDVKNDITSPEMVSLHKQGILDESSSDWHGQLLVDSKNKLDECRNCHGKNLGGFEDTPGCTKCHSVMDLHSQDIGKSSAPGWHANIMNLITWDLTKCQECHGTDYAGTAYAPSCKTCHTSDRGPQACNTCHGEFADPTKVAPPADLSGNTSTSAKGVGAHTAHLNVAEISNSLKCSTCHGQFPGFSNHIDGLPAEIEFTDAAVYLGATPTYNASGNLECSNTYCHGNFSFLKSDSQSPLGYSADKITGNNVSVIWNEVGTGQAECGTCHGLPPAGHSTFSGTIQGKEDCYLCHGNVVDNTGKIINPELHMNGVKD